ncbi:MAG: hypothetical protein LBD01_03520, partial [Puniceicoccales bacterium]|nr:hypothetical protein [Puniceicoccales bacterium]
WPPAHAIASIRPRAPTADVESVHAAIENEFFDLENFSGRAHFIAMAGTYQHFYNFARKNRSRANKTPVELLREKAPICTLTSSFYTLAFSTHTWVNFCLDLTPDRRVLKESQVRTRRR